MSSTGTPPNSLRRPRTAIRGSPHPKQHPFPTLAAHLKFVSGGRVGAASARSALNELQGLFDPQWGGFGFAPKFPAAPRLLFLLEQARSAINSTQERETLLGMADLTLRRMWRGGIHDHLGGGFARYATDEQWPTLIPLNRMKRITKFIWSTRDFLQHVRGCKACMDELEIYYIVHVGRCFPRRWIGLGILSLV